MKFGTARIQQKQKDLETNSLTPFDNSAGLRSTTYYMTMYYININVPSSNKYKYVFDTDYVFNDN